MRLLADARERFRALFFRDRENRELEEELRFHIDMQIDKNIAHGMNPREARRQAHLRLGGLTPVREATRDARGVRWLDALIQDVRYGVRGIRANPLFTLSLVATLGLGIGASTAIFSVVDHILFRPLDLRDADRVVTLCETHESLRGACIASTPNVADWASRSRTLEEVGAARTGARTLWAGEGAQLVTVGIATPGFLRALGLTAALGRTFAEADMPHLGAAPVAMLTDEFWRLEFAGDPEVVGRTISLDGEDHIVIGVMSTREVPRLERARIWLPLPWDPATEANRQWRGFRTAARLAPAARPEEAEAELEVIQASLAAAYPDAVEGWGVSVRPMHEHVVGSVRPMLLLFLVGVAVVLIIVCVNMAGLLVARAISRHREMVVRTALGAGRGRITRQLLTETGLLAVLGGVAGALMALWGTRTLVALAPPGIPRIDEVTVDLRVLGFAFLMAAVSGVLFGVPPALRAGRLKVADVLRDGRGRPSGRSGNRLRRVLVAAQLALALMLVAGAGLLMKSFAGLLDWQPGFETERVLTFQVFPPQGSYENVEQILALYVELERQLSELPGVESVGTASAGPLFGGGDGATPFLVGGGADEDVRDAPSVAWYDVGPTYFETLGMPVLAGRGLNEFDGPSGRSVALINDAMARRYWPESTPLGSLLTLPNLDATVEIVGVVDDIDPFLPGVSAEPELYFSNRQRTRGATYFVVRTEIAPERLAAAVTDVVQGVNPDMVPVRLQPLNDLVAAQLVGPRFNMILVGLFALVALVLGAVGIYGVIAYAVEAQWREIGIRMALGAPRTRIVRRVFGEGLLLVGIGVGVGAAGALMFTRLMSGLLYGVSPTDPLSFAATAAVMVVVGLAACAAPAVRASRLDPMQALRRE